MSTTLVPFSEKLPNPLNGFLGDFVEFEHYEGDNDFTKIPQYFFFRLGALPGGLALYSTV